MKSGESLDDAFSDFLSLFFCSPTDEARLALLAEAPPLVGDPRLEALAGAVAEYLAKQYCLPTVPAWVSDPVRYLERPWHMCDPTDLGRREYLTFASPAEFKSRNIFTVESPLRWGRRGMVH